MSWLAKSRTSSPATRQAHEPEIAVEATPQNVPAMLAEARRLEGEHRRGEALRLLNGAIERFPRNADLRLARGSTLYSWSRFHDAYHAYGESLALFPENVDLIARFGWTAHVLGNAGEAEACMNRVVDLRPDVADAHYGRGVVLQSMKRYEAAAEVFRTVIDLDANAAHAFTHLGVCLMDLGRFAEAEIPLRRSIELAARNPGAWLNLGVNLYRQGTLGAEEAYQQAERLEHETGEFVDTFVSYASYLRNVGRVSEAIAMYFKYLPGHPNTSGLTQLGMCLMHTGDFVNGWNLYEFRWLQEPLISLRANLDTPVWQGQDIDGKTILVRAEQGIGDVIQFARYLPLVKQLGATVVFQGRDGMAELSTRFVGVDKVINSGDAFPEFQYLTNLMSLPRFFGNDPRVSPVRERYIRIDESRSAYFRSRLDPKMLNIGLVWAGNPTHLQDQTRSMPLSLFDELANLPNTRIYSLQKGEAAKQLTCGDGDSAIVDWSTELNHFGDTADAIAALDLVISVDTSVAHLAGALGKPVWVLLPNPAEWRWMDERRYSDWYPGARLFRQSVRGDWLGVIEDLKVTLSSFMADRVHIVDPVMKLGEILEIAPVHTTFTPITVPSGLTAIGEMREGIFQYFPDRDEGAPLQRYGEWLHEQLGLLARLIKLGQTLVEIGGGVGVHTVAVSRLVGAQGHIMVYENDHRVKGVLRQNLRANKARNVTVMMNPFGMAAPTGTHAESESVDDLELKDLDWLKVNSADDALAVLKGAEQTLWRTRPKLFLNVGNVQEEVTAHLAAMAYSCWMHRSEVYRRHNFNNADSDGARYVSQIAILAIPEEVVVDVDLSGCIPIAR
ncbi:MAG: tetratricopeptide repeat-containing glycosyltransferase family protein [Betaproteobacteria bacterium]